MRKLTFYSLFLALLFIGCSQDDSEKISENQSFEIKMNANVTATTLRTTGPINSDFSDNFNIGVYAYKGAWATTNLIDNDAATVSGTEGHSITFGSGPYYYPSDGATVNFFAFSPRATVKTAAATGSSPVVTFTITGQEDILWASDTGYKSGSSAASHPEMGFSHKLTQLQFKFASGTGYPASGNSVISLIVKGQSGKVDMNVGTGVCTFSKSEDDTIDITALNSSEGVSIVTAGTNANSPIMTSPETSYLFDIVVKPAGGGSNVTYSNVPLTLTSLAGNAHLITFSFTATSASASATVSDWATGASESVTVL